MLFPWPHALGGIFHNLDDEQQVRQVPRHEHADAEHGSAGVLGNDRLGDLPARRQLQSATGSCGRSVGICGLHQALAGDGDRLRPVEHVEDLRLERGWGRQVPVGADHLLNVVEDRADLVVTDDRMEPDLVSAKEQQRHVREGAGAEAATDRQVHLVPDAPPSPLLMVQLDRHGVVTPLGMPAAAPGRTDEELPGRRKTLIGCPSPRQTMLRTDDIWQERVRLAIASEVVS